MLENHQKIYLPVKRLIDFVGSSVGIIVLSPLFIAAAIITKCVTKGPTLFKQTRLGKKKKTFTLYKFRSMRPDAPQIPPEKMTEERQRSLTTGWGEFMRKTSIDEIPQLFNIWLGSMSFIGPRPSQTVDYEADLVCARDSFIPNAYEVKPGLSGYAQIHLHRNHDIMKKASDDSYYVKHMSFWFDIKLFFYSFFVLFGFAKGR
jgi:O-antigen biosynthesis protein WbqP